MNAVAASAAAVPESGAAVVAKAALLRTIVCSVWCVGVGLFVRVRACVHVCVFVSACVRVCARERACVRARTSMCPSLTRCGRVLVCGYADSRICSSITNLREMARALLRTSA